MKTLLLAMALLSAPVPEPDRLDSITVTASRAGINTPVAYTDVRSEDLKAVSPMSSLPMAFNTQPSVISTSEGGTSLGYTAISIRGVGANQTNVTLNGITLNDPEDQQVFWANIPGLSNIVSSVQVQRGLGTSSNGPAAFGASINMNTGAPGTSPSAGAEYGAGSYRTRTFSAKASTGLLAGGFSAEAAWSSGTTDGYMDNGFADVRSIFGTAGWRNGSDALKLAFLYGKQRSGITWNGVPLALYPQDRTYNANMGDTDNYTQTHTQLNYLHQFGPALSWNTTLNYTAGSGWYDLSGMKDSMDNSLFVLRSDLRLDALLFLLNGGVYLSWFNGSRYGDSGYSNEASKRETDAWVRGEFKVWSNLTAYADVQFRRVFYDIDGPDEYGQILDYHNDWFFVNPRAGATYEIDKHDKVFASIAMGHREPSRADIQADLSVMRERMYDFEIAHEYTGKNYTHSWNFYAMEYRDMLLETGRLNAGGYAIKDNVAKAHRRGTEYCYDWHMFRWLRVSGNLMRSRNRIKGGADLLLSPEKVRNTSVTVRPVKGLDLSWNTKYVGKQYWDNTGSEERMIPAYRVSNVSAIYEFEIRRMPGKMTVGVYVNNLFNKDYYASAWVYRAQMENGMTYQEEGLFPQALRNYMFKLGYSF